MIGIYFIVNTITKTVYVGQSVNMPKRFKRHISDLKNQKHGNQHLQSSWNKYGGDVFVFKVVSECAVTDLTALEQCCLSELKLRGFEVFNKGACADVPMRGVTGDSHPLKGKKLSDEHRLKLSIAHRGKTQTEETRLKRSLALKGRPRAKEVVEAIRQAHIGKSNGPLSVEHRRKLSVAAKNYWATADTR